MASSHIPKKGFPFFVHDPEGEGLLFFDTVAEADKFAEEAIKGYLDVGEWVEDVERVVSGVVTQKATQVDRIDRPTDPEEAEDEGWPPECEYHCNYKMLPLWMGQP